MSSLELLLLPAIFIFAYYKFFSFRWTRYYVIARVCLLCHPNLVTLIELLYTLVDRSYNVAGRDSSGKVWLLNLIHEEVCLGMAVLL